MPPPPTHTQYNLQQYTYTTTDPHNTGLSEVYGKPNV